jgi:rhodanese-related sulfurtransferase
MKKTNFWILCILLAFVFVTSCKKDDDPDPTPAVNESEVLATYLESTSSPLGKDYVNSDMPSITSATDVYTLNLTGQVYIIDIRSAADFDSGHIANAHNMPLADVLTHVAALDQTPYSKVVIVCYSGQTAGFATLLLRIAGYDKVFSMKWGMCSWNEKFAAGWQTAIGNAYATQLVKTETPKGPMGNMPVLSTGKTTGPEILQARLAVLLTEGYGPAKVDKATLFGNLTSYYIVNYWPADQYADFGHVPGATQYTPKASIKLAADLKTLPTDKPIAVYCYTGQTSSFLAAYLRLLGYDAKSLLYGMNGMAHDDMGAAGMTIFTDAQIMGYEYVK